MLPFDGGPKAHFNRIGGRESDIGEKPKERENKWTENRLPANEKRALWYWFDVNGHMAKGWKEINGKWEMFADSGEWLYTWQAN